MKKIWFDEAWEDYIFRILSDFWRFKRSVATGEKDI